MYFKMIIYSILLNIFLVSLKEPVAAVFGSPVHWSENRFFQTRPIWEQMILRMHVIFQTEEKHVIHCDVIFCH